jgi:hypothetical protein
LSKKSEKRDILQEAKKRFSACKEYYSEEYKRGQEDLDFLLGTTQWPEAVRAEREKSGRPCLTENRLLPHAHQVINSIRQSRPAIGVNPVDDTADVETAKIYKGLIRNIEYVSGADNATDTAAWNAISAGYGFIRINTKFADEQSFDKEIEILRVLNPFSVYLDKDSKELDGCDAEYAFIYDDIDRDSFEEQYPDADPVSFDEPENAEWCEKDKVRIVEYFYKDYSSKTIYQLADGTVTEEEPSGWVNKRTVRVPSIKWCKFSANDILEETEWDGIYIPIIPVYGEEVWQAGRRKSFSLIHQAKDAQQRFNYWLTASTEIIALQPKAPYVGLTGQFKTGASKWATANVKNHAFIEYDIVYDANGTPIASPPQRQSPPMGSPAMFQEMMAAADGIKATIGMFNPSLGMESDAKSGKAILAQQAQGDNATFHFVDNLQSSIRQVGRVLVDLIPKIYTGQKIARIIGDDDTPQNVPINQAVVKQGKEYFQAGKAKGESGFIDLQRGKYDVVCSVGASFQTKRQEMVAFFQELYRAMPQSAAYTADIFFKNLDIPEADVLAERMKALLPPEVRGDDPAQAQLQQAAGQIQAMQQAMAQMDAALQQKRQKDDAELQAELAKMQAEIEYKKAETAKTMAEIAQMQAQGLGITPEMVQEIVRTVSTLEAGLNDIAQAVDMILSHEESKRVASPPAQMVMNQEETQE